MKRAYKITLALLLGLFILQIIHQIQDDHILKSQSPTAANGVLDLSRWDLKKSGPVKLDGAWEFYWGENLSTASLQSNTLQTALPDREYVQVPSKWEKSSARHVRVGIATYHLKILVNRETASFGIKTTSIRMASKIFVNGVYLGGNGTLNPYQSKNIPATMYFTSSKPYIDLIVQVSNQDYYSGGIVQSILLGTQQQIISLQDRLMMIDLAMIACLLITTVYYFGIFLGVKKDRSLIVLSLYTLLFAFVTSMNNEKLFMVFFSQAPYLFTLKLKESAVDLIILLMCLFCRENGENFVPPRFLKAVSVFFLSGALLSLIAPARIYAAIDNLFFLVGLLMHIVLMVFLIRSIRRGYYGNVEKSGAYLLLFGLVFVLIHFSCEVLYVDSVIGDTLIGNLALLLYLIIISVMLSQKYTRAFTTIESMSAQLVRLDRQKDEFLINTSHELKTPLHGIINIAQHIADHAEQLPAQKIAEDLSYVVTIGSRLNSLIHDIIDFQSIKANQLHLVTKNFDVHVPVQAVSDVMEKMFASKKIQLINRIEPSRYFVLADDYRVRQVLYNLIGNALKFTQHGFVELSAEMVEGMPIIYVRDTGIGIESGHEEDIFNYFGYIGDHTYENLSSSGLGLAISKQLAEQMGGKLWLQSTVLGQGSVFALMLPCGESLVPCSDSLPKQPAVSETSSYQAQAQAEYHEGDTILVVDDEVTNIKVIADIFVPEGYTILTAYTGMQALELLKQNQNISLVLLDVMMPQMSGFEVCQRIREEHDLSELPVLMLTVRNHPEDIAAGLSAGANDFLSKPFDARELKARVSTLLELRQSVKTSIQMELAFLHSQIKPHFIFNALSVIMALIETDGEQAGKLLGEFSRYLRYSFDFDTETSIVPLEKELAMVRSYAAIESARFGDKLNIRYEVDPALHLCSIPALSIQPLVENSIRHGLMKRSSGGTICVTASAQNGYLLLQIEDNGVGMASETQEQLLDLDVARKGVGIRNIHKRLLRLYGRGLLLESQEGIGTCVSMQIPLPNFIKTENESCIE